MARYVSRKYDLPMITEVARSVLAEMETSLEALRTDVDLVGAYQTKVFKRQLETERAEGKNYVSDRAFDNLAYAAEHTTVLHKLVGSKEFKRYISWLRNDSRVFFVRPHEHLLQSDGTRERLVWDSVVRIDGMVKFMLEQFNIPYMILESASMQERCRIVDYVLK